MAEKRAGGAHPSAPPQDDLDAEVSHVADQLYALTPDDFTPARDAAVRAAREAGRQPLAREIARLRKPTQSAWLINLLWRDQHAVMEQLFELSHELAQAQADAAGATLRELTAQRRQIENALMRRAVELGTQAGVRVSDSITREAQETLSAALALPEVADEVRSGHLVKPASYAGFGASSAIAAPSAKPSPAPIDLDAVRQRRTADEADAEQERRARQEQKERERAAAERHLAQVRHDAERAAQRVADAAKAADEARARVDDLQQRLDTLRAQLQRLESEVDAAQARATEAEEERRRAEANEAEARKAIEEAEAALTE